MAAVFPPGAPIPVVAAANPAQVQAEVDQGLAQVGVPPGVIAALANGAKLRMTRSRRCMTRFVRVSLVLYQVLVLVLWWSWRRFITKVKSVISVMKSIVALT
jgi:hypothetical protein